jgi:hypothetical protein
VSIEEHLRSDPLLRDLLARHPGVRVPGGWEPGEVRIRISTWSSENLEAWRPWQEYGLMLLWQKTFDQRNYDLLRNSSRIVDSARA